MKKQNKKHESGRSMFEMVGVLAVMGLITAAAFVLITSAMRSQKLSRADDDIAALAAGVRLLYNNSADNGGYKGITTATSAGTLKALGFENVKPAYGTDSNYTIAPATKTVSNNVVTWADCATNATTCNGFSIKFNTDSENTCKGLAQRTWANGGKSECTGAALKIYFDDGK